MEFNHQIGVWGDQGPVAEGTKFYVRDGLYYLVIPEGGYADFTAFEYEHDGPCGRRE